MKRIPGYIKERLSENFSFQQALKTGVSVREYTVNMPYRTLAPFLVLMKGKYRPHKMKQTMMHEISNYWKNT